MSITCFTAPSSPPRPSGDPAPARTGGNGDDGDRDAEPVPVTLLVVPGGPGLGQLLWA